VLGRQKWVVVSQWATIAVLAVIGAVLVPRYTGLGAALGALVAVGIGRLVAQVMVVVLARAWVHRPYPVAFSAKFLLSLALPAVVTAIWQPSQFIAQLVSHLRWLPTTLSGVVEQGLTLTVEGVIFVVIFLICLRVVRPLDSEDAALLSEVPTWLQKVLLPFVDKRSLKRNTGV
jgi:hypothetical protein